MKFLPTLLVGFATSVFLNVASADNCTSKEAALRVAKEAVAEREEWPHGGDYNVSAEPEGWRVTAWRIDFPKHEGSARYAGGGFRVIHIGPEGELRRYSRQ